MTPRVGCDVEDIMRWRGMLPDLQGTQRSMFTPTEHADCLAEADPAPHYAARWCAKEAAVKAVGREEGLHVRDIEVRRENGRPILFIRGRRRDDLAVSLSHSTSIALAVVSADASRPISGQTSPD